jgi:hypothetical protein
MERGAGREAWKEMVPHWHWILGFDEVEEGLGSVRDGSWLIVIPLVV